MIDFKNCFSKLTGNQPFHWQEELFKRFVGGTIPNECDVPTGLGKTSVIAIWLLALGQSLMAQQASRRIPRRLVYVVDRRVIVDQSTDEAQRVIGVLEEARSKGTSHSDNPLSSIAKAFWGTTFIKDGPMVALSTLRGQLAEDREWCLDPSRPAIIIGTVDMIGSRLLFSGYGGLGRSHRSLQAGLLGQDTLVLIDEAHLSPTFVGTVRDIKAAVHQFHVIRPFEVMSLSATIASEGSDASNTPYERLPFDPDQELRSEEARHRLNAEKYIKWHCFDQPKKDKKKPSRKEIEEQMAATIVEHASQYYEGHSLSIVIFVSTVGLVNQVGEKLAEKLGEDSASRILRMTGEMRGIERDRLTENEKFKVFLPYRNRDVQRPTHYLIATSCAEVGVNLDADHGICDLTSLDSMIQRIGRINRFGKTQSTVTVVVDQNALKATESDILQEQVFHDKLVDLDRRIGAAEKRVEQFKERMRELKDKDEKALRKTEIIIAEAELKSAKKEKKETDDSGVNYDKAFINIQRVVDRTAYYTWLVLKSKEGETGKITASPLALRDLPHDQRAWPTPPVRPHLDSARLDDWSMTSLRQAEFHRPLVAYWMRGVTVDETVQTTFCWRADLNYADSNEQTENMARAIPINPCERAVMATPRAESAINELAKHWPDMFVVLVDASGEYEAISLQQLTEEKSPLFNRLASATVIIPSKAGGLSGDGNVLEKIPKNPAVVIDAVDEAEWARYVVKCIDGGGCECGKLGNNGEVVEAVFYSDLKEALKVCAEESGGICVNLKELHKAFLANQSAESAASEENQREPLIMIAYFLSRQSSQHYLREADDMASLGMEHGRTVDEHDADVEQYVKEIARNIGLDEELIATLGLAGLGHDRGKNRDWWQAAIGNPNTDKTDWKPLAKSSSKSFDHNLNQYYRHEFGSLVEAEANNAFDAHPHRDLILHLIAAHHGYARPHFPAEAFDRSQPTAMNRKIAQEVMQRFTRLQYKYGWWQLAYLEALVKAADALASRDFNRGRL